MTQTDPTPMSLPKKGPDGHPPSAHPEFVPALTAAWYEQVKAQPDFDLALAIPDAGPYRASYAGKRCDRELWYALNQVDQSNPPGIATQWSFFMGHAVHDAFQTALRKMRPNLRVEVAVDLNGIGIAGSAHADALTSVCRKCAAPMLPNRTEQRAHRREDGKTETWTVYRCDECSNETTWLPPEGFDLTAERAEEVIELKGVNSTGYTTMATRDRGAPAGPRSGHILQPAMIAVAAEAPRFVVIYVSFENFSGWRHAKYAFDQSEIGKFTAEWIFHTADWRTVVRNEAKRIRWVAGQQVRPPRRLNDEEYPVGSIVTDPHPKHGWATYHVEPEYNEDGEMVKFTGMGTAWMCVDYCGFRDQCVKDGR